MKLTESKYLFDTTAFLDFLRHRPVAQNIIEQAILGGMDVGYSIITEAEVWAGIKPPRTEKDHIILLRHFRRHNVTVGIAHRAGQLLTPYIGIRGLSLPSIADAIIAATAEYHGLTICTSNEKHFTMFPVPLAIYKV